MSSFHRKSKSSANSRFGKNLGDISQDDVGLSSGFRNHELKDDDPLGRAREEQAYSSNKRRRSQRRQHQPMKETNDLESKGITAGYMGLCSSSSDTENDDVDNTSRKSITTLAGTTNSNPAFQSKRGQRCPGYPAPSKEEVPIDVDKDSEGSGARELRGNSHKNSCLVTDMEQPIPRKLSNEPNSKTFHVPRLTKIPLERSKRKRFTTDVDDGKPMGRADIHRGCSQKQSSPLEYINNMKSLIKTVERPTTLPMTRSEAEKSVTKTRADRSKCIRKSGGDPSLSRRKPSKLHLVKQNIKRKRGTPTTVIPGSTFTSKPDTATHWRAEKDQDEYHQRKKDTSRAHPLNWNPLSGNEYSARTSSTPDSGRSYAHRSLRRKQTPPEPVTIDICSESEDETTTVSKEEGDSVVSEFPLKRLGLVDSNKIFRHHEHGAKIKYNDKSETIEISYSEFQSETILIHMNDLDELTVFPKDQGRFAGKDDQQSFVHLAGTTTKGTRKSRTNRRILIEFEKEQHFEDFNAATSETERSGVVFTGNPDDVSTVASLFLKDTKSLTKNRQRTRTSTKRTIDPFIAEMKRKDILLVYPFDCDRKRMEDAARGLQELSWRDTTVGSDGEQQIDTKSHYIEIRVEDYEQLNERQWLNDSLIDLWMQWISRDTSCNQTSDVHFFTSHFYTTLDSEGPGGVQSWTAKKNINVFKKKMIFIPINESLHWSLCVVLNPGAIVEFLDDEENNDRPLPCMLFFDSLNMHRKGAVHRNILGWLNSEWNRLEKSNVDPPFNKKSCKIYDPQVPRQNNGSDCGVFVCRYAFAMFQLRHLGFSYRDAGLDKIEYAQRRNRKARNRPIPKVFSDLITDGESFHFGVDDIQRIRKEFKTLIKNLHPLYKEAKKDRIKAEKEEKKAKRESLRKERDDVVGNTRQCVTVAVSSDSSSSKDNRESLDHRDENLDPQENILDLKDSKGTSFNQDENEPSSTPQEKNEEGYNDDQSEGTDDLIVI